MGCGGIGRAGGRIGGRSRWGGRSLGAGGRSRLGGRGRSFLGAGDGVVVEFWWLMEIEVVAVVGASFEVGSRM